MMEIDPKVCNLCAYRMSQACDTCAPEGKYRRFSLKALSRRELFIEPPSMSELVDDNPQTRLVKMHIQQELQFRRVLEEIKYR